MKHKKHQRSKENPPDYKPTVIVSTRNMGSHIEISVKDNGVGIDEEQQQKIFEPFYTTKNKEDGTGLGLSIVKQIVERHGGEISVESQEGKGSTFTIILPKDSSTPVCY